MNTGQYISGIGHLALIGYAVIGGMFLTPSRESQIQTQEVALISEAEFAALTEQNSTPEPTAEPPQSAPEVTESAPSLPDDVFSPEDPGAGLEAKDDTPPAPKPAQRIADLVVPETPDVTEVAPMPTPAVTQEAETPQEAEEVQEAAEPEASTTEIVTEAEKPSGLSTSLRPKSRPTELAEAAQERQETPPAPTETTSSEPNRPVGPPLTSGEREGLRVSVSQCWNVGAMSTEAMRTVITVGVAMNEDGTPQVGSIRLLGFEGGSQTGANSAFEVARRAIIRCGARGFPLPRDKYARWRNIEMTFDPEQMRFK